MKTKKKIDNIYDKYLTYENIYDTYKIVKKTCKNKKGLFLFEQNLNTNIYQIYNELKQRTYKPNKFYPFLIFEPKPRLVMNQIVKDKIVNHFVANYYLIPFLEKTLIDTNVATRKEKGSKYLMDKLKLYYNKLIINNPDKEIYVLKMDIKKFFYKIDHEIIMNKLKKKYDDNDVLNLVKIIIDETNNDFINEYVKKVNKIHNLDIPLYLNNKGLSIGAQISQFLAIYYLNDLDHYIKEKLKCKYYCHYMDDLIILDTDKERLKECFLLISEKLGEERLEFNDKSNIYRSSIGFNFVGKKYKVKDNKLYITSNKKTYKKVNKNLNNKEKYDYIGYYKSLASYKGFFKDVGIPIKVDDFKLSNKDIYNFFKKNNKNFIVIFKEKQYYKCYDESALILNFLFEDDFFFDDLYFFHEKHYCDIINKLNINNLNCAIFIKSDILFYFKKYDDFYYDNLLNKAKEYYKKNNIIRRIKRLIDDDYCYYLKINEFLNNM